MYAALLLAFFAVPPDAPPVMPPDAPPTSFQSWASAELDRQRADVSSTDVGVAKQRESVVDRVGSGKVVDQVCPCGERCECVDCECPDCPHRKAGRLPRLRVTVWDKGCGRCEAFKSGAMAELGWTVGGPSDQIEIVTVPGNHEDSPPAPSFEYIRSDGVESWVGYENRDEFVSKLRRAMDLPFTPKRPAESVQVMRDARLHDASKPVQTQPVRLFVPRLPGTEWSGPEQSRESIINHLLSHPNHRGKYSAAQLNALDYRSLENLHDNDHNRHPPSSSIRSQPVYTQPVRSGCPGGVCPSPQRSGGLFGWGLFR